MLARFLSPELLNGPPDLVRRARLAIALAGVSSAFFVLAALVHAQGSNKGAALLDVGCALLTLGAPFAVRRTGRVALVTHAVLGLVFAAVFTLAVLVRGAGLTGVTLMMMVIPLFATLIVGPRGGAVWLGASLAGGVTLGALEHAGLIEDQLTGPVRLFNDHLVLLVFTALLFAVATVFENRKDEALRHISELERQRGLAELGEARARAAAQLAQAEQFASLGRIAAATAHEINNPLSYVLSNLEFVARAITQGADPELLSALGDARDGAARIQRIVSHVKSISPAASGLITEVEVPAALAEAIKLAAPHTAPRARVRTRFEAVPRVSANHSRLTQVFLSLLLNAAQNLPEGAPEAHEIAVEVEAHEGWVRVEISNSGRGVSLREGVSLAVILGEAVVRSFGGALVFETAPGRTMARLTLKLAAENSLSA